MAGHLFITRGDISKLAVDAWLLPTDAMLNVSPPWRRRLSEAEWDAISSVTVPDAWNASLQRSFAVDPSSDPESRAWLTNVGAVPGTPSWWYEAGAREFLDRAADALVTRPPLHQRARHLLALPVVGTGLGGALDISGDVVRSLIEMLQSWVTGSDFDVVLVTFAESAFAAAQSARKHSQHEVERAFSALSPELRATASNLASLAKAGRLVLFIGAGVSSAAGLPRWGELLDRLAYLADIDTDLAAQLASFNDLDRARIIASRLEALGIDLGDQVSKETATDRYALGHSLLSTLPVSEVITTNYDRLFETVGESLDEPISVIPYAIEPSARRWLLKLHGCVSQPNDIVLTRTDYIRYGERRAALAAIVQAMLVTRHLMYVGFSLTDDNFHRIVDEVKRAISGNTGQPSPFGTALVLENNVLREELWKGDLTCVNVGGNRFQPDEAARNLEIFLDLLATFSTESSSHLLDPNFNGALTEAERSLRDRLLSVRRNLSESELQTDAGVRFRLFLEEMGGNHAK